MSSRFSTDLAFSDALARLDDALQLVSATQPSDDLRYASQLGHLTAWLALNHPELVDEFVHVALDHVERRSH